MIKSVAFFLFFGTCGAWTLQAQTTYIPLWAKESWLLDRLEIKARVQQDLNLSAFKPYGRKVFVQVADSIRELLNKGQNPVSLTSTDQYNLDRFQANNAEFSRMGNGNGLPSWKTKKPILGFMYPVKANLYEVKEKDFFLVINAAINQQQSIESGTSKRIYLNAKGLTARGMIANKIGFHFFLTDNQEQGPLSFRRYVDSNGTVHGAGWWKVIFNNNGGVDYFDARGSVSWKLNRYMDMQFGYDQHFIGSGYRSVFLSHFANPNLFLRLNTRLGKFNLNSIFTEIFPVNPVRSNALDNRKYMSLHHLSINVLKWLNVGVFESMVYGNQNSFNLSYLQPVILMNSLLGRKNGQNNASLGLDVKANLFNRYQLYGQFLLDNLDKKENSPAFNAWSNRHAYQLGGKYVDAFGLKNLDVQAELNQIRPFTYSGNTPVNAFNHYRQQLVHPLGSNLREVVGIIRYQPLPRVYFSGRVISWKQGLDSAGFNFGANSLIPNTSVAQGGKRLRDGGYPMFAGLVSNGLNASANISYELRENLFLDLGGMFRRFDKQGSDRQTIKMVTVGIRWNTFRREYDY